MLLKIKKLSGKATIPCYAKEGDAGLDLIATSKSNAGKDANYIEFGTDLAIEIEEGHVGLIFPRSSISKTGHRLVNSVGVIDSGYRGEVKIRMSPTSFSPYQVGDKIAQLVIMELPKIVIEEVEELDDSDRGSGGFGSTDELPQRIWR
jgi:dUTP pyrophosphatase